MIKCYKHGFWHPKAASCQPLRSWKEKGGNRQWKQIHPKLSVYISNESPNPICDRRVSCSILLLFSLAIFLLPPNVTVVHRIYVRATKSDNFNVFNNLWRDQAFVWKFCWLWPHTVWVTVPASSTHLQRVEPIFYEYPFRATPIGLSAHTRTLNIEWAWKIYRIRTHTPTTPGCVYAAR